MTRFCTSCGHPIADNGSFCTNCGAPVAAPYGQPTYSQPAPPPPPQPQPQYQQAPYQQPYVGVKPKNYMVWAVLATIFCCLPLGIWSIVCASKVNKAWEKGDYVGANDASKKAKTWIIVAIILGLIVNVYYVYSSGVLEQLNIR